MKKRKLLEALLEGRSDRNIRFDQMCSLLIYLGFEQRIKGSHHIFSIPHVREIINVQPLPDGNAKAYQVKEVRRILLHYNLTLGADDGE